MTSDPDEEATPVGDPLTGIESPGVASKDPIVDLDILRGWTEHRDPSLRQRHQLPAIAHLIELDEREQPTSLRIPLHGPDLLLGRFQSQYAPVDHSFHGLADHQLYRVGAPHVHLSHDRGQWFIEAVSPRANTLVEGEKLSHLDDRRELNDGDAISLGVTLFLFRSEEAKLELWDQARQHLFDELDEPALFLKRRGGCCGPMIGLDEEQPLILGRSFPPPGSMPNTSEWPERDDFFWDLSGLYDHERKYVAFRHARVELRKGRWTIQPLSARQRTFVNRIAISGRIALESGDEIGLGSVLLRFHHPHRSLDRSRPRYVPTVVDWSEGRTPSTPPPEKK